MPTTELFNEERLRKDIAGVWGEHGAHIDVYDHLVKRARALAEANDVLRSARAIAGRYDDDGLTAWSAFRGRLDRVLKDQHRLMYPADGGDEHA